METMETMALVDTDVDNRLTQIYEESFPAVAQALSKMGCSFDEAREVFHDALIAWYEKDRAGKIPAHVTTVAYLVGIARHLYLRKFRHAEYRLLDDEFQLTDETQPTTNEKRLLKLLQHSGRTCLDLLQAFYYDKLSAANLVAAFGFGSIRSATVQKFKCLEKVRSIVKQKSLRYEDFFE